MRWLRPRTPEQALKQLAATEGAIPVAGGTGVMVELNAGRIAPEPAALLDLSRLEGLGGFSAGEGEGTLRLGATLTYSELIDSPLAGQLPALAEAATAVGSRQIRNRGTIGGALASRPLRGDIVPPLLVAGAELELHRLAHNGGGPRVERVALASLGRGGAAEPIRGLEGSLLVAVHLARPTGPQAFLKLGDRAGSSRPIVSLAVGVDRDRELVSAAATGEAAVPVLLHASLREADSLPGRVAAAAFGAGQGGGRDRDAAAYRRHALEVLVARALTRCGT